MVCFADVMVACPNGNGLFQNVIYNIKVRASLCIGRQYDSCARRVTDHLNRQIHEIQCELQYIQKFYENIRCNNGAFCSMCCCLQAYCWCLEHALHQSLLETALVLGATLNRLNFAYDTSFNLFGLVKYQYITKKSRGLSPLAISMENTTKVIKNSFVSMNGSMKTFN